MSYLSVHLFFCSPRFCSVINCHVFCSHTGMCQDRSLIRNFTPCPKTRRNLWCANFKDIIFPTVLYTVPLVVKSHFGGPEVPASEGGDSSSISSYDFIPFNLKIQQFFLHYCKFARINSGSLWGIFFMFHQKLNSGKLFNGQQSLILFLIIFMYQQALVQAVSQCIVLTEVNISSVLFF